MARKGRKPKLNEEDCEDIRRLYFDRNQKWSMDRLAVFFRVSQATIQKVLDKKYKPRKNNIE